jgi:hypothetical protein
MIKDEISIDLKDAQTGRPLIEAKISRKLTREIESLLESHHINFNSVATVNLPKEYGKYNPKPSPKIVVSIYPKNRFSDLID